MNTFGLFITFEGSEGCGKSTQIARMRTRLETLLGGERVVVLREPGGTAIGEEIRCLLKSAARGRDLLPEAELLLFAASRAQLVREVVQPALAAGAVVLCDRFLDSTTVYQGVARRLDPEAVQTINAFAAGDCLPDATLLFDLPMAVARHRMEARAKAAGSSLASDRMDGETAEFFEAVRAGYRQLAETQGERFIVIDAGRSPEEVEHAAWTQLQTRFHGFFSRHGT